MVRRLLLCPFSERALLVLVIMAASTIVLVNCQQKNVALLDDKDYFGGDVASVGDLDGDSVGDIVVGAWGDDDGGTDRGAVWVLFLKSDGTVKGHQKISQTQGNFTGTLDNLDAFGSSVASVGDLDGDSVGDIVVGADGDDDGGTDRGAVWVLFLKSDGTVKGHQKISQTQGNFTGTLSNLDAFGFSVGSVGDLDGDSVGDIVVGADRDDDGGPERGAVWVLFLKSDGTVKGHQKISQTQGNFTGTLVDLDVFGSSVGSVGDLDGDSVGDIVVGALGDDDGGRTRGAVWVLFLKSDGTVKGHQKISQTQGNFTGTLDEFDFFGDSVASVGDLDGDSVGDIVVGATGDDDGGGTRGAVWVLFLKSDGTVKGHQKISQTQGNFTDTLDVEGYFGSSAVFVGDLDGDSVGDIVVGARVVWVLFLKNDGTVKSQVALRPAVAP